VTEEAANSVLDGKVARGMAFLVFLGCLGLLAYLHRNDFFPGEEQESVAENDPAATCITERSADIARMFEEGLIGEEQAGVFRERAIGMCRDVTGGSGGGPTLPKMPQQ
jgi:hypothetical protein